MTGGPPACVRRMRRRTIGEPSDSNCNSYLPFLFVAVHEILETCCEARLPISLQFPVDPSTSGTGNPSSFGRSLDLNCISSIGSSYRLSRDRTPWSPEKVTMWL